MARPGITYDDVKETALALLGQGCAPSIQRIREQLGTGSNSTISGHLKRWRQEISATPRTVLPATVPEAVLEALERFWGIALEQAETLYQEARARDQEQVRAAQQARDDALGDQQQARAEAAQLHRQAAGLSTQVRALEDQLLVEREQRAAAQAAIAAAHQQAAEATAAGERLRDELQA
ncbi:MAG: DNA-binding protein, partial [Pseudomonadota bacterium]|nr:DNA-binding protein [Pseudomonadota bacterium]